MKKAANFKKDLSAGKLSAVLLFVLAAVVFSRLMFYVVYWIKTGDASVYEYFRKYCCYDSGWYKSIIENGYEEYAGLHSRPGTANWAFFPLMPLVVRLFHAVTGADTYFIGSLVNTAAFVLTLGVCFKYIILTRKSLYQALIFTVLLAFGPYTFYFSALYTESFYMLFLVLFLYFMKQEKWVLMGISGCLCSGVRNTGIMLVFAAVVFIIQKYAMEQKNKSLTGFFKFAFSDAKFVFGVCLVPLGIFSFMLYLHGLTGDGLAFVHVQRAWGGGASGNPISTLVTALMDVYHIQFYFAVWVILSLVSAYVLARKKHFDEAALCLILILIPISVRMKSAPRYIIGSFLPMLGWTDLLKRLRKPEAVVVLVPLVLYSCFLYTRWLAADNFLT